MNTEPKPQTTPVTDIIRIMQEYDFFNMHAASKQDFFEMFLAWEQLHMRWTYNHGYADGKFPRVQDFDTYFKKHYKTTTK